MKKDKIYTQFWVISLLQNHITEKINLLNALKYN